MRAAVVIAFVLMSATLALVERTEAVPARLHLQHAHRLKQRLESHSRVALDEVVRNDVARGEGEGEGEGERERAERDTAGAETQSGVTTVGGAAIAKVWHDTAMARDGFRAVSLAMAALKVVNGFNVMVRGNGQLPAGALRDGVQALGAPPAFPDAGNAHRTRIGQFIADNFGGTHRAQSLAGAEALKNAHAYVSYWFRLLRLHTEALFPVVRDRVTALQNSVVPLEVTERTQLTPIRDALDPAGQLGLALARVCGANVDVNDDVLRRAFVAPIMRKIRVAVADALHRALTASTQLTAATTARVNAWPGPGPVPINGFNNAVDAQLASCDAFVNWAVAFRQPAHLLGWMTAGAAAIDVRGFLQDEDQDRIAVPASLRVDPTALGAQNVPFVNAQSVPGTVNLGARESIYRGWTYTVGVDGVVESASGYLKAPPIGFNAPTAMVFGQALAGGDPARTQARVLQATSHHWPRQHNSGDRAGLNDDLRDYLRAIALDDEWADAAGHIRADCLGGGTHFYNFVPQGRLANSRLAAVEKRVQTLVLDGDLTVEVTVTQQYANNPDAGNSDLRADGWSYRPWGTRYRVRVIAASAQGLPYDSIQRDEPNVRL